MIKIKAENQHNLKDTQTAESQSQNTLVKQKIAGIRGGKAAEFVEKALKHGKGFIESGVQVVADLEDEKDASEPLDRLGKNANSLFKETVAEVSDNWEKVKEDFKQGKLSQSVRWWMLNHGSTAAFDHRISKQDRKLKNLEDRKQREARRFNELHAKFAKGEMSEQDIERSMREHLREFEKEEEKERIKKEQVEKEKKAHEQEVQELKNSVNDRITKAINDIKLETDYDINKEKQGALKEQIDKGETLLAKNKKEHKELEAKCKLIYGDGWLSASWLRKKFNITKSEDKVLGKLSEKEAEKLISGEKADFEHAKKGLKKTMEDERMSFENVAMLTKDSLEAHAIEIKRLETNLAHLRAFKDPIDTEVLKAEKRIGKFEAERKSFAIAEKIDGLADEAVGEQVEVKGFANLKESKDNNLKLLGKEVLDLESKIKSPAVWFGKATAFNFKVSGYENHTDPKRTQEVLLNIRKETDSVIFKLEKTATKINSTIKSKDTDKKDKPELEKQLKDVTDKISELKKNILDKIPLDRDGNISEDVDQEAILHELCPDISIVSKDKKEVFGNELKTDKEKAEALKTLQEAVAETDDLASPFARLKAYSKTVAFILDSKLRADYANADAEKDNTKAIDEIYLSIINEKIPRLFGEINDPRVAVEEGLNAIKILAESGSGPNSSSEMMQAITQGISENIRNSTDANSAYDALVLFTEQYCALDESILKSASGSIDTLLATGLANSVVRKIKESENIADASKTIADLAMVFAENSNNKISPQYVKEYFDVALTHLETENNSDIVSSKDLEDPYTSEYRVALRYIEDKMNSLGMAHGEKVGTERTVDEMSAEIERLNQNKDMSGLAEFATELAIRHHPDEALRAIDLAQSLCAGDTRLLLYVADTFASVDDEFYRIKIDEIYDSVLSSLENKKLNQYTYYIDLMDSLNRIDSGEQMHAVAESFASKMMETASTNPRDCINLLGKFIHMTDRCNNEVTRNDLFNISQNISKGLYDTFSKDKNNKTNTVKLIATMENSQLVDSAFELFSNQIKTQSIEDAFQFIKSLGAANEISNESKDKYIDKVINKIVSESTVVISAGVNPEATLVEISPIVKNLVNLYRELNASGFNSKSKNLFEDNIDLESQDNLVGLIDMLSQDLSNTDTSKLVETYTSKAIENSSGDFESTLNLMTHWADLNNNLYVSVNSVARKMANKDFEKLVMLADVMNRHNINLGLETTILEAEIIAKEHLESKGFKVDTGFSELEKVVELYKSVQNLQGEAQRLEDEIEEMKNAETMDKTKNLEVLNENSFTSTDDTDFIPRSIESSFPAAFSSPDANFSGKTANQAPKKKRGFIAGFFRSLFGLSND